MSHYYYITIMPVDTFLCWIMLWLDLTIGIRHSNYLDQYQMFYSTSQEQCIWYTLGFFLGFFML